MGDREPEHCADASAGRQNNVILTETHLKVAAVVTVLNESNIPQVQDGYKNLKSKQTPDIRH